MVKLSLLAILLTGCAGFDVFKSRAAAVIEEGIVRSESFICEDLPIGIVKGKYGLHGTIRREEYEKFCNRGKVIPLTGE